MNDLNFFIKAYNYMLNSIDESLNKIDDGVIRDCLELLSNGVKEKRITVNGSGRSLLSVLLFNDSAENWYGTRVSQVNNANLRPLIKEDIFISNSRSGSGRTLKDALFANKKELKTVFITSNEKLINAFDYVILIPKNDERVKDYSLLGTEFEQASAVLCSCLGQAFNEDNKINSYEETRDRIINEMKTNLANLTEQADSINNFNEIINNYLINDKNVYFIGLGTNEIISRVAAIRYGHLSNEEKDLRVIYEGHWKSRKKEDLCILISGSGETSQIITYAEQALETGMNVFGITSFNDSMLGELTRPYGNLIITGREWAESDYNTSITDMKSKFLPLFELNTYLTLDSLLALIAKSNGITEDDMKRTHRDEELE